MLEPNIAQNIDSHKEFFDSEVIQEVFKDYIDKPIWVAFSVSDKKLPYNPNGGTPAKSNEASSWGTFLEVLLFIKRQAAGKWVPALALKGAKDLVVVDLDHVCTDASLLPEAATLTQQLDTYCEYSTSGRGLHAYVHASKAGDRCKLNCTSSYKKTAWALEIYDKQLIIVTGKSREPHRPIRAAQSALDNIYARYFPENATGGEKVGPFTPSMPDDQVISLCRKEKNPTKFVKIFDEGERIEHNGDESSLDQAVINKLVFYSQNREQVERIFCSSKFYATKSDKHKEKWDLRDDYRERTFNKALKSCETFYRLPGRVPHNVPMQQNQPPAMPIADLKTVGLGNFLKTTLPERPLIVAPWLRKQDTVMLHAWRGIGKTMFCLNLAYSIASGREFLGWTVEAPCKVLYIDGEMQAEALQKRLGNIVNRDKSKHPPSDEYFQILASDMQDAGLPYLDTTEGQARIQPYVDQADVIFIDNLSTLTCQAENEAPAWMPMQEWILRMRRAGKTVVLVHHTGKGGQQRGHSKREDTLNVVINLKRPKDYVPEQGARFELHFEKAREVYGRPVVPLEVKAEERNGFIYWNHSTLEDALLTQIKEMLLEGMKDIEIMKELEIPRRTYYRYKKKIGMAD